MLLTSSLFGLDYSQVRVNFIKNSIFALLKGLERDVCKSTHTDGEEIYRGLSTSFGRYHASLKVLKLGGCFLARFINIGLFQDFIVLFGDTLGY